MGIGNVARVATVVTLQMSLVSVAGGRETAAEPFEVGQRWVYQHEGPRPGNIDPNIIDGEKILQVVSVFDVNEERQWVIEERFTGDPNVTAQLFVGRDRLLAGFDVENEKGELARFTYVPPVPYQVPDLEIGAERTFESTLRIASADFSLPTTIVIQRLPDETVETPAGTFTDCRHYKMTTRSTINIKIAKIRTSEERQRWYHPTVNGLVKEVYRKNPIKFLGKEFKPGYTATSTLTAFDVADVQSTFDPNRPPPPASPSQNKKADWIPLAGLILLMATAFVLARRIRAKRRRAST